MWDGRSRPPLLTCDLGLRIIILVAGQVTPRAKVSGLFDKHPNPLHPFDINVKGGGRGARPTWVSVRGLRFWERLTVQAKRIPRAIVPRFRMTDSPGGGNCRSLHCAVAALRLRSG
jgi:hypothetical protein